MTTSIEQHLHDAAPAPDGSPIRPGRDRIVTSLWAVFGCGMIGGASLLSVDIVRHDDIRFAIYATLLLAVAALAGAVLAIAHMFAEREQWYRRGHLMGWMRGWRGQEPLADDPLIHH